jgi:hypothetical protein
MNNQQPLILLDVDGVLNPFPFTDIKRDWKFEPTFTSSIESGQFSLNLSKEMGQALLDLNCQIQWLTTWIRHEDFANPNIGKALDWPIQKEAQLVIAGLTDPFWKVRTVKSILSIPGPKVIWIDDDAARFIEHFSDWSLLDPHDRLQIIVPDPQVGLTKRHIQIINDFINET